MDLTDAPGMLGRTLALAGAVVLVSTLALGCGGSAKLRCGEVQPCGGDLVGKWSMEEGCFDLNAATGGAIDLVKLVCPGVSYRGTGTVSGTAGFAATTFAITLAATVSISMHLPESCLHGLSCGAVDQLFGSSLTATGSSLQCTGTSACDCALTQFVPVMETGTYATSGTTLTMTPADGSASHTVDYCVDGSVLHLITVGSTDMSKIAGDVVGTR